MALNAVKTVRSFGGELRVFSHASQVLGTTQEFAVYAPPNPGAGPLPVLWYLSGLTCTWQNVAEKGFLQAKAAELGLILVMPDTSPRRAGLAGEDDHWDFGTGAGFYLDATEEPWSKHYRMESYLIEELPGLLGEALGPDCPADLKRQGITGHSMGGHGALVLGLRHPDIYRSISAFAPICNPSVVPWGQKAFGAYLGEDKAKWAAYDACELVVEKPRKDVTLLVDQGLADSFLERELKPELLEAACNKAGQPLTLRRHAGYDHSYYFIASFAADHVTHHAAALK